MQVFDESIDKYSGSPPVSLNVIDPTALPNHLDENGKCVRLFPHSAMKSNTIFEVVRASGGHTAWADKHPAYDLVNGPSGKGVEDLFTPEITNVGALDNTVSVVCTVNNDALKVQGILNEIKGLKHDGTPGPGVPAVFGMNFQAVSVGQKLSRDNSDGSCIADKTFTGQAGGYTDGAGTPTAMHRVWEALRPAAHQCGVPDRRSGRAFCSPCCAADRLRPACQPASWPARTAGHPSESDRSAA